MADATVNSLEQAVRVVFGVVRGIVVGVVQVVVSSGRTFWQSIVAEVKKEL